MNDLQRIAVVIDADNTQLSKMGDVLREVSTHGRIVVKRAYGNWRKEELKNWEPEIKRLAIKAIQQFDYVSRKNATDIALVIDTIDLLHTNIYDAFVIVSSDSDYTPLAIRLHESGVYVIGVGEAHTPASFKNSCDEFLLLENIVTSPDADSVKSAPPAPCKTECSPAASVSSMVCSCNALSDGIDKIHCLLKSAYFAYQDDNGFANIASVGSFLKRTKPDFDCRGRGTR